MASADLLNRNGLLAQSISPLAPKPPRLPVKAKAVISIFCYGGVSHVHTFDPKPLLLDPQRASDCSILRLLLLEPSTARATDAVLPRPDRP
ncbi:MAG: DUF1501 domain-containing protein [Chloracidobacterium sp.]|nr:DUF1501 domain-containing protein [Chloracidobacterium sp.]